MKTPNNRTLRSSVALKAQCAVTLVTIVMAEGCIRTHDLGTYDFGKLLFVILNYVCVQSKAFLVQNFAIILFILFILFILT